MAGDEKTRGLDKAYDSMKHLTTLCTGIIGLTVTFAKEFKVSQTDLSVPFALKLGWFGFAVSLFFALWSLLAITGSLNEMDTGNEGASNDAMRSNVRIPSLVAVLSFVFAIVCTIWASAFIVR
jgi:hypothetical protein